MKYSFPWPKLLCFAATGWLLAAGTANADPFSTLRNYWQTNLIAQGGSPSSIASTANGYWSSMETSANRTELWSDLPFGSVSANLVSTYNRLQAMALAWATPGSSLQNNSSLAAAVAGGLDWMNTNVYSTTAIEYNNWFHWEISGPQSLENTAILLYPALTGTEITNYCAAIDRFAPGGAGAAYGWMTGANTSDKVLSMLLRGIMGRSTNSMTNAQANLSPVFPYVTGSDGFYVDGSFVFHGVIAYNGHYGIVLLGDIPRIVNLLNGSPWQITDPNLANVYAWVTNSFEPLIYHGAMMDMVRGRAVSWSYETESGDGGGVFSAMRQIAQFAPEPMATAFNNFVNSPELPPAQYNFASMDRVVANRAAFTYAISMSSSRIANYESINSGNLHGWFQGDGMTYLYLGNSESQFSGDFWPTVDPYHMPGATDEQNSHANSAGEATTTGQNWAGGAQVAKTYGSAGMSLATWNTSLTGRKSWFMLDNEIVCLGAGITCGGPSEVDTTVENRRLGTSPTNNFWVNGTKIAPVMGWSSNITSATWCALDGVAGYYFPGGATNLQADFEADSGSWSAINSGDDGTTRTDDYLKMIFNAGIKPTNSTYAYVLLPNFNVTSVSNYAKSPDIIVLTNTVNVQAVRKPALGVVAANFWTNGTSTADLITVNNKSSIITLETSNILSVGISDPTQTNTGSILVTLNRSASNVISADTGITVSQLAPNIVFSVNLNGSAGKSLQTVFAYSNSPIPIISGVYPDGNNMFESTNTIAFSVVSAAGVTSNGIAVKVNGLTVTNLVLGGTTNNWSVTYPHLQPNMLYSLAVTIMDVNGNVNSFTNQFDTFNPLNYTWEAEDFDYAAGRYVDNPQTNAYAGLAATTNVDAHQVNFGGKDLYRPNGMDTEVNGDMLRRPYQGTGYSDYSLGYFSPGSWVNYTRHYPAGKYYVYARLAAGVAATTCTLSRVTNGWGTTAQGSHVLGTFYVPLTAWEQYSQIPLVDGSSNLVAVTFTGATNTLQLIRPPSAGADCNANFLMLVPVFTVSAVSSNNNILVNFPTQPGFNYQLYYVSNLTSGGWAPTGINLPGDGTIKTLSDVSSQYARFYRVVVQ